MGLNFYENTVISSQKLGVRKHLLHSVLCRVTTNKRRKFIERKKRNLHFPLFSGSSHLESWRDCGKLGFASFFYDGLPATALFTACARSLMPVTSGHRRK